MLKDYFPPKFTIFGNLSQGDGITITLINGTRYPLIFDIFTSFGVKNDYALFRKINLALSTFVILNRL